MIPVQVANTHPSLATDNYCGRYENELYGFVEIVLADGQLKASFNTKIKCSLTHYHYDTFKVVYEKKEYTPSYINFHLDSNGKINELESDGVIFEKTK